MNTKLIFILIILLTSCISCKEKLNTLTPDVNKRFPVFETKGNIIPSDSLLPPRVFKMKNLKPIKSGPPTTLEIEENKLPLNNIEIKSIKAPEIKTPGKDDCKRPAPYAISKIINKAGKPDKITLIDPEISLSDDKFISTYMETHGVRPGGIGHMLEDSLGNLWMCSNLTGIIRFDGRHLYFYSQKHGLAGSEANKIIQDDNLGFWIATNSGLSRFDGINFTNYLFEGKRQNNQRIHSIVKDNIGNLWIGSEDGLYKMNIKNGSSIRYDDSSGLLKNEINHLTIDSKGGIWITYVNGGLSMLESTDNSDLPYQFKHYREPAYFSSIIEDVYEDLDGHIWIASKNGALILKEINENNFDYTVTVINKKNGLASNHVLAFTQDKLTKEMYLAINKIGIEILNTEDSTLYHRKLETSKPVWFAHLFRDSKNEIWFGSDFGFSRIADNPFNVLNLNVNGANYQPTRITEDKWGRTWFGTYGAGIFLYEPEKEGSLAKLHQFSTPNGMSSSFVDDIVGDQKGNLWIGLRDYGLIKMELDENSISGTFKNYLEKNDFPAGLVPNLILDKNDDLWCALYEYGSQPTSGICRVREDEILHIGINQGLINDDTWDLIQDDVGDLWIGSARNGLTKYQLTSDSTQGNVTQFTLNHYLLGLRIWSLVMDRNSNIWAGANGGEGLVEISPSQTDSSYTITHITKSEGLLDNNISALEEDYIGNIWVGSRSGLSQLKTNNSEVIDIINYTHLDGFPHAGVFFSGMHLSPDSTLWVRSNTLISNFKPDQLHVDYGTPELQLNTVLLYNEEVDWKTNAKIILRNGIEISNCRFDSLIQWNQQPQNLSLRHDNNFVSFDFNGISVHSPHKLLYSYQLEGWSDRWSLESPDNTAVFGTLEPGSYVFKVKAKHQQGEWSLPIEYAFTIRPPWWKSILAYIIYALALLGILGLIINSQIRKARWRIQILEEIRTNISLDLHDDVGTVMSGVAMQAEYLAAAEPEDIKAEMTQISEMSREAIEKMRDIVWALNPRKDKFENLIDRMHSFAEVILGNSKFNYTFDVKDIVGEKFISPELRRTIYLIFKEAVQNIYKHSNGNLVNISLGRNKDGFSLSIFDNGHGTSNINTDGLGISNMRIRAEKNGVDFQIIKKGGFTIQLQFREKSSK